MLDRGVYHNLSSSGQVSYVPTGLFLRTPGIGLAIANFQPGSSGFRDLTLGGWQAEWPSRQRAFTPAAPLRRESAAETEARLYFPRSTASLRQPPRTTSYLGANSGVLSGLLPRL